MGFLTKDRNQIDIIGYSINDFVDEKSKCRFIVKLIEKLNLEKLYKRYSPQGGEAYDPSIMLAIWFLGYSESVTSSRKLEELCNRDLQYIYISGNMHPDHTSLSRFRKTHLDLIPEYFVELIMLAKGSGISDFKTIAIDGSKLKASCSKMQSKQEKYLTAQIKEVQCEIKNYMDLCELSEEKPETEELSEIRKKINKLKKMERKLTDRKHQLVERKKGLLKKDREKHQINITEPDAYMMNHGPGKSSEPSYNVQISIDTRTQLITANDVVQDRSDYHQFSKQHQATEKNLGEDKERQYVADSGYNTLEQMQYIMDEEVKALIADANFVEEPGRKDKTESLLKSGRRLKRDDFRYNRKGDYYVCPWGRKLNYNGRFKNGEKHIGKRYFLESCKGCKLIKQCHNALSKGKRKYLYIDDREESAKKMREELRKPESKALLKLRSMSVEPVFGNIKSNLGYSRFRLRGLNQVKGEFNLMCVGHNINKLFSKLIYYFLNLFFTDKRINIIVFN